MEKGYKLEKGKAIKMIWENAEKAQERDDQGKKLGLEGHVWPLDSMGKTHGAAGKSRNYLTCLIVRRGGENFIPHKMVKAYFLSLSLFLHLMVSLLPLISTTFFSLASSLINSALLFRMAVLSLIL